MSDSNAVQGVGILRLAVVLGVFPVVLVFLFPQLDYVTKFFDGDRSLWLPFWITAAAFEWTAMIVVLLTFVGKSESLEKIGFPLRPARMTILAAAIAAGTAIWAAITLTGISSESAAHLPEGTRLFLPPPDTGMRLFWVFVSFTAAFCEETLFRGVAITELRKLTGSVWIAVLVSSFAFTFFHGGFGQGALIFGIRFALSLALAGLFVWTGRLAPSMLVHFLADASLLAAS